MSEGQGKFLARLKLSWHGWVKGTAEMRLAQTAARKRLRTIQKLFVPET